MNQSNIWANAMKIAVSKYRSRVAPVFDWSHRLLIVEKNRHKDTQMEITLARLGSVERVDILVRFNIETLICGVVSDWLFSLAEARNIRLIPGVSGRVEEVIEAFFTGNLNQDRHTMPGCGELRRKSHLRRRGLEMKR